MSMYDGLPFSCLSLQTLMTRTHQLICKTENVILNLTAPLVSSNTNHKKPAQYHYSLFKSIESAGNDWDLAAPAHNIFLQRPYLSILEQNPPSGMRFGYLVFYADAQPIGVAICQIKHFNAADSLQESDTQKEGACLLNRVARWFRRNMVGFVSADVLICGNLLLTGENSYYFDAAHIHPTAALALLESAVQASVKQLEEKRVKIPVVLFKDLSPEHTDATEYLRGKDYLPFQIQPNMVMPLAFANFETYLNAMSTKYRTRAKRAFKKLEGIQCCGMRVSEIEAALPQIHALYKSVANNAGFNMVDLNPAYLLALKRDFGAYFNIYGLYLEEKMIAFYTTIQNQGIMEAHFIGYDKTYNHDYQVYLNMLYKMVQAGIESGSNEIVFARTALEIKSSVGAVPQQLNCFVKHKNSILNRFTNTAMDYLKPEEVWQQRHPFK